MADIKLIIVEDYRYNLISYMKMLSTLDGIEVVDGVRNSQDLFLLLEDDKITNPDIILLDYELKKSKSELTSLKIIEKIKGDEKTRRIKIAIFTGYDDDVRIIRSIKRAGADAFLSKDIIAETALKDTIFEIIGSSEFVVDSNTSKMLSNITLDGEKTSIKRTYFSEEEILLIKMLASHTLEQIGQALYEKMGEGNNEYGNRKREAEERKKVVAGKFGLKKTKEAEIIICALKHGVVTIDELYDVNWIK